MCTVPSYLPKSIDIPPITRRYPADKPPITRILKEAGYLRVISGLRTAQERLCVIC